MLIKEFSRQSTMYPPKIQPFFVRTNSFAIPSKKFEQTEGQTLKPSEKVSKTWFFDVLFEFTAKSSIHAIPFIGDRKRHWIERLCFMIGLLLSLSLCVSSIHSVWTKWREALIVLQAHSKLFPIHLIPFPAISICPLNRFSSKKFNYTDVYRAMLHLDGNQSRIVTDDERMNMKVACQICDEATARDIYNLFNDSFSDETIMSAISDLAPHLNTTMRLCMFTENNKNCSDIFYPMVTEEGLCYTFNVMNDMMTDEAAVEFLDKSFKPLPPSNWDSESGYDESVADPYPYRVFGTGTSSSLFIVLKILDNDVNFLCGSAISGFKVTLQSPYEQPQLWKNYFYISPGIASWASISPRVIMTRPGVARYAPNIKHCFFNSERRLRFFKEYSQDNCEMECLANFTLASCGCVRMHMPRSKTDQICGPAKLKCCTDAHSKIYEVGPERCNCLPACTTITYNIDVTEADYHFNEYLNELEQNTVVQADNVTFSSLLISFQEERFIPQERIESNNLIDIIAQSGGIFGLCCGASLLSFFELFYYLTLRMFFMRRNVRNLNRGRF